MSVEDRLTRLERRFMALEVLVRQRLPLPYPTELSADVAPPPAEEVFPVPPPPPARSPGRPAPQPVELPASESLSAEQWFGQRGVLGVAVLLLILGGAYFLKIAIDRGWISPAARCIAAVIGGGTVAGVGWWAHRRGTETFGAALIGAGAGLMYLAVWAASSLYSLVSLEMGIIGLAVVSYAASAVAYRLNVEALGAAAALGALLGPIVVGAEASSTNGLLVYLGGVGLSLGVTAVRREWHATTLLIVATSLLLAFPAMEHAGALLGYAFGVTAGLACLSLRQRWADIGVIGFLGAWGLLLRVPAQIGAPWLVVACGVLLAVPIWWKSLGSNVVWPAGGVTESGERWSVPESLLFYLVPLMIEATINAAFPSWTAARRGASELLLAVPYLVVGYARVGFFRKSRSMFALVGTTAAGLAAFNWPVTGIVAVITMLGLGLLWSALDHLQRRNDGRWYALMTLGWAGIRFNGIFRAPDGAAFLDSWALTFWLGIVVTVVLALGLWKVTPADDDAGGSAEQVPWHYRTLGQQSFLDLARTLPPEVRSLLWVAAGIMLFGGVTTELTRLIGQLNFSPEAVPLARGLAVSTWWALFAGGLVVFGFYRRLAAARIAGLFVAALAVVKVLFFDLANLDQLYRVGSFIILALVLLYVAFLYHRQAAGTQDDRSPVA